MVLSSKRMIETDIAILGAGPAGCACALELSNSGLKVLLIDKAAFPRDKICGDALSPDVVKQLGMISESLAQRFEQHPKKQFIRGIRMYSPSGNMAELDLNLEKPGALNGYTMTRLHFDQILAEEVKAQPAITIWENTEVSAITQQQDGINLQSSKGTINAKMLFAADGAQSMAAKQLTNRKLDREHHCGALRQYYTNVSFPLSTDRIELHFIQDVLPGYVWIFPMSDNTANVGIGMLSSALAKKKVNLRQTLEHVLHHDDRFKQRFAQAQSLENSKGFGIPIGSKKFVLSGNYFLLGGDAAHLVDPLSGEGIGNALRSGRFAAKHLIKCFEQQRFDADFNTQYDQVIYKLLQREFQLSRFVQRLFQHPRAVNLFVSAAAKSKRYRRLLQHLLETNFFSRWASFDYYFGKGK